MLKQKSFLSFIFNILSSLLGFLSVFFISRFMGPEALGAISSSLAFVGIFSITGDLGFGIAHYKRVSEGKDLGQCIGTFLIIRLGTTLLMALLTLGVFYGSYFLSGKYPVDEKYLTIFVIIFISSLIGNMIYVITYTFSARIEKAKEVVSLFLNKFVASSIKVIVALSGLGIVFLAWANMAGVIAGAIVSLFLFRNYPIGSFNSDVFKSYIEFAIPSILIGVTETVSMNLDKVFISYFAGTAQVGYYTSSQSITHILSFVGTIFVGLLLPTYSAFHAKGEIHKISDLAYRIEKYISILIFPLVFFVFFFSDPIRQLILGNKFKPSSIILAILSLNAMLVIFNQPYSSQLMGMGKIKTAVWLGLTMVSLNIVLNLILIPENLFSIRMLGLGAKGAAISLLVSSFVGTWFFRFFAYKLSGSTPNNFVFRPLIASLICFGGAYWIFNSIHPEPYYYFLLFAFAAGLVYIALMQISGSIKREDYKFYLNLVNPKLLKDYVIKEIKE